MSQLSDAFEALARISYLSRKLIEDSSSNAKSLQEALAEEGVEVDISPLNCIDVASIPEKVRGKFIKAWIRVRAKALGKDPDETEALGLACLLAGHFDITIELAEQLALGIVKGEIGREEQDALDFIAAQAGD